MSSRNDLGAAFANARHSVFRLETLQDYRDNDAAFGQWRAGRVPDDPERGEYAAMVRAACSRGVRWQRVHVATEPLTEYLRFELTWCYSSNVKAGEDVRVIPVREGQGWPVDVGRADFWLFDSSDLFAMEYASDGAWVGVTRIPGTGSQAVAACRQRDAALRQSIPWEEFIAARPELAGLLPVETWRAS